MWQRNLLGMVVYLSYVHDLCVLMQKYLTQFLTYSLCWQVHTLQLSYLRMSKAILFWAVQITK